MFNKLGNIGLAMAIAAARSAGMSLVPVEEEQKRESARSSEPSARERPRAIYVAPSLAKSVRLAKEGRGAAARRRKQAEKIAAKRERSNGEG